MGYKESSGKDMSMRQAINKPNSLQSSVLTRTIDLEHSLAGAMHAHLQQMHGQKPPRLGDLAMDMAGLETDLSLFDRKQQRFVSRIFTSRHLVFPPPTPAVHEKSSNSSTSASASATSTSTSHNGKL